MKKISKLEYWLFCSLLVGLISVATAGELDPKRWEDAIGEFESADKRHFPDQVEILFLGSSSIKLWDLTKYFPGRKTLNRGFGGSQISDSFFYAERLVFPYSPNKIVFYAGDNDIASGKSPQIVFSDYQAFVEKVRNHLEDIRIIFVSIKPSLSRWHLVGKMREANRMIEEFSSRDPLLYYLDIDELMVGADGKPRVELFADDGLHLSAEGYELWSRALAPLLD